MDNENRSFFCGNGEFETYPTMGEALVAAVRSLEQYEMESCRVYSVGTDPEDVRPVCRVSVLAD